MLAIHHSDLIAEVRERARGLEHGTRRLILEMAERLEILDQAERENAQTHYTLKANLTDEQMQELKNMLSCGGGIMVASDDPPSVEIIPRWIPVTERLPEERTEVLIVLRVHKFDGTDVMNVATALYAGCRDWIVADYLEAIEASTDGTDCEDCCHWVTHWMPLPQPPKGE